MSRILDNIEELAKEQVYNISTISRRTIKQVVLEKVTWKKMIDKFKNPVRTNETFAEYMAMNKKEQDDIKDVGGFIGGILKGNTRAKENVINRCMICLDADDSSGVDIVSRFTSLFNGVSFILHSTHKHCTDNQRYRLIIPLQEPIKGIQYEQVSKTIANMIGIEVFDKSTYQAERIMYFPSCSADGDYVFNYHDGIPLNAMMVCGQEIEQQIVNKQLKEYVHPSKKSGIVGAFCSAYTIQEVIEKYLGDVYEQTKQDRYTYINGTTSNGVVVFDDTYIYSHHASDPIGGKCVNAYDLLRLHRFGEGKESEKEMKELLSKDGNIKRYLVENISNDKENVDSWVELLKVDNNGDIVEHTNNYVLILENDEELKDKFKYNLMAHRIDVDGKMPWKKESSPFDNVDEHELKVYIEKKYNLDHQSKLISAMTSVANKHSFHPVIEYLESLEWDGVERIESTFQRFLGVSDGHYSRSVAKHFAGGAIERVMNRKGSKLDEMVVLIGEQGIGKSTIFKKLGKEWFSDSLAKMEGKEAYEALHGWWIIETPELTGMKKSDVENIKHFLAKQSDTFRPAYGRFTVTFNRQCVIVGTTNTKNFLKDKTGNRRFLPLDTNKENVEIDIMEMNEHYVDQFWAEAYENYKCGAPWRMDKEALNEAEEQRENFMDENPLQGLIEEFIKIPIKREEEWDRMSAETKKTYFIDKALQYGNTKRKHICAIEVWCELQGKEKEEYNRREAYEINEVLDSIKCLRKNGARKRFGCYGMQRVYDIME